MYKGRVLKTDGDVKDALDACYAEKRLFLEVDLVQEASLPGTEAPEPTSSPAAVPDAQSRPPSTADEDAALEKLSPQAAPVSPQPDRKSAERRAARLSVGNLAQLSTVDEDAALEQLLARSPQVNRKSQPSVSPQGSSVSPQTTPVDEDAAQLLSPSPQVNRKRADSRASKVSVGLQPMPSQEAVVADKPLPRFVNTLHQESMRPVASSAPSDLSPLAGAAASSEDAAVERLLSKFSRTGHTLASQTSPPAAKRGLVPTTATELHVPAESPPRTAMQAVAEVRVVQHAAPVRERRYSDVTPPLLVTCDDAPSATAGHEEAAAKALELLRREKELELERRRGDCAAVLFFHVMTLRFLVCVCVCVCVRVCVSCSLWLVGPRKPPPCSLRNPLQTTTVFFVVRLITVPSLGAGCCWLLTPAV